ncbi:hypothetical protein AB0N71_01775 [Pseudarthrobacter enclensis]|uniref:hypothetical protein n=1 Tax=Pseudarthrobacter enclensis TaxID=993070 RepID=UPI003415489E
MPPIDATYISDWTLLKRGDDVIALEKTAEHRGRVDAVADDGLIMWLHLEGGRGRRLFASADDVLVRRLS